MSDEHTGFVPARDSCSMALVSSNSFPFLHLFYVRKDATFDMSAVLADIANINIQK